MPRLFCAVAALTLAFGTCAAADPAPAKGNDEGKGNASAAQHVAEVERNLDLPGLMRAHGIPGMSIAVIDNFKITWAKGYGVTEKDALANVTQLAEEHVRALVEAGQSAPRASRAAEMPSATRSKEFGRALIPVDIGRAAVRPSATNSAHH